MIPNEERHKAKSERRQRWNFLAVKKLLGLSRGTISKNNSDFYFWIVFISLERNTNLNNNVKIKTFATLECLLRTLKY